MLYSRLGIYQYLCTMTRRAFIPSLLVLLFFRRCCFGASLCKSSSIIVMAIGQWYQFWFRVRRNCLSATYRHSSYTILMAINLYHIGSGFGCISVGTSFCPSVLHHVLSSLPIILVVYNTAKIFIPWLITWLLKWDGIQLSSKTPDVYVRTHLQYFVYRHDMICP